MALHPLAAGEALEQGAIQAASGAVIDVLRRRLLPEAGEAQPGGQALAVALQRLTVHQHGQPVLEAEFGAVRLSPLLLERPGHAGEAELA